MSFHSLEFLVFLVAFFVGYWCLRGTTRLLLCLAASYLFYGWWDYRFLSLVLLSTVVDYCVGLALAKSNAPTKRKSWLGLSLVVNLGILATFKYFDFFSESLQQLANSIGWQFDTPTLNLILPLGISFYTFQTLSYSIDVYRGKLQAESSLLKFATYVAFFPQLVAGPIVRASEFLPQLATDRQWSFANFHTGFGLILLGFFKKLVIADNIAILVEHLFGNPEAYTAVNTAVVVVLYSFQIYGDFAGYSDIAIGIALMLGFVFPVNFRFPYFSQSFGEFWRRWHITLSTWLRDYLYIPLGGNRGSQFATARNLMITMLLGGLWHGANWTFVLWGILHGILLVIHHLIRDRADRAEAKSKHRSLELAISIAKIGFIFACVSLLWVLFRAENMSQATRVLQQLGPMDGWSPSSLQDRIPLLKACFLVWLFVLGEFVFFVGIWHWLEQRLPAIRVLGYAVLLWMIALFGTFGGTAFIYFQF